MEQQSKVNNVANPSNNIFEHDFLRIKSMIKVAVVASILTSCPGDLGLIFVPHKPGYTGSLNSCLKLQSTSAIIVKR